MRPTRRAALAGLSALALSACGFELRKAPVFAFQRIVVKGVSNTSALIRRSLKAAGTVTLIDMAAPADELASADAVLDVLAEDRSRLVLSTNAAGEVKELELMLTFRFRVATPAGVERLPATTIVQRRDLSYNETSAIAKESEAELLYRDMQADTAQQVLRRLGAIR